MASRLCLVLVSNMVGRPPMAEQEKHLQVQETTQAAAASWVTVQAQGF
jgi:hypothetical protein